MLEYYKSLNPTYSNVSWLITECDYCQTAKMVEYFKSLNPDYDDVHLLIEECEYCQSEEIKQILLKGLENES